MPQQPASRMPLIPQFTICRPADSSGSEARHNGVDYTQPAVIESPNAMQRRCALRNRYRTYVTPHDWQHRSRSDSLICNICASVKSCSGMRRIGTSSHSNPIPEDACITRAQKQVARRLNPAEMKSLAAIRSSPRHQYKYGLTVRPKRPKNVGQHMEARRPGSYCQ